MVAEQCGKRTNLESASAFCFWLLEASQGLKRNCSAKSHPCPYPPWHMKTDQKKAPSNEVRVAMSTLGEKNSSCYFLLRDLGVLSSKTSPLRLTICCFWTCSKPPFLSRTVKKLVVRQTLEPGHPRVSCAPRLPGAQLENVTGCPSWGARSQWPGSSSGCPTHTCAWGCHSQEDFMKVMLMGHPFTLEQCKMSPLLALPIQFCSVIQRCSGDSLPLQSMRVR